MNKEVYTVKACEQCVNFLIGFVAVQIGPVEEAKCEFCKKKKPVHYYRITSEKGGTNG